MTNVCTTPHQRASRPAARGTRSWPSARRAPAARATALCLLVAGLLSCFVIGAQPGSAAPAAPGYGLDTGTAATPDVVLINQPARSVCVGRTFTVGVWYQRLSGGSRAYRVAVYGPRRIRFFYRHGLASAAHWRFWKIRAGRAGWYRIVYSGHRPNSKKWSRYVAFTHARRC